jgi:riboflavin kinase/FMN adenylyltransferase
MAVYTIGENTLPIFDNPIITMGTFDGVHQGHVQLFNKMKEEAERVQGTSIVITFDPHPRHFLEPNSGVLLLTPLAQKINYILQAGIDHVVVVPFHKAFASLSAQAYVEEFIWEQFHPHTIIIGYDHHFGHDRKGNIDLLKSYKEKYPFQLIEIPASQLNNIAISSTKLRKALSEGDLNTAFEMTHRHYKLEGIVVQGNQLGRTIGYPTANIQLSDPLQLIPHQGVYSGYLTIAQERLKCMINIGIRPTVSLGNNITIEAHIFDFDRTIYGFTISLELYSFIRSEIKFASLDALKSQLATDAAIAKNALKNTN